MGIWYLKYQIPTSLKVFVKVFKYQEVFMYFVFYSNTNFWVFDTTLAMVSLSWLKVKRYSSSCTRLRATGRHLPCGITQCYLPPDTSERAPPNLSQKGWYSINLPRRDRRLSCIPTWCTYLDMISRPGNGSASTTNVVVLLVVFLAVSTKAFSFYSRSWK